MVRIDGRIVRFDLRWSEPTDPTLMQAYAGLIALTPRRYLGQCQRGPRAAAAGDAHRSRLQRNRDHYPLQRLPKGALCDAAIEYHLRPLLSSVCEVAGAWNESTRSHRPS